MSVLACALHSSTAGGYAQHAAVMDGAVSEPGPAAGRAVHAQLHMHRHLASIEPVHSPSAAMLHCGLCLIPDAHDPQGRT